jgi:S-phase kinase-associated protein 1
MDECDRRLVKLSSSDGRIFPPVTFDVVSLSSFVAAAAEFCNDEEIDVCVPNVRAEVLSLIICFCHHHKAEPITIEKPHCSNDIYELVPKWYADFVVNMERAMFFDLMAAANFMEIHPLIELTCLVASIIFTGKSASAIRSVFNRNPE